MPHAFCSFLFPTGKCALEFCHVLLNRLFMYRSSLKATVKHVITCIVIDFLWAEMVFWSWSVYCDYNIFSWWVWLMFMMKISLTQSKMCLYYRSSTFSQLWLFVKLDKCKSKHDVTLFSLRHINHFLLFCLCHVHVLLYLAKPKA